MRPAADGERSVKDSSHRTEWSRPQRSLNRFFSYALHHSQPITTGAISRLPPIFSTESSRSMDCRLGTVLLAVAASGAQLGCSQTSRLAGRVMFPAGVRYGAEHRPGAKVPQSGGRPPYPVAAPPGPRSEPFGQMVRNQRPGAAPPNVGTAGPPEVIATPRPVPPAAGRLPGPPEMIATPHPDGAPRVPPAMSPCPPGQVLRSMPPAERRVPKWRGFLPAHGTREDRPGWWTPDYGGGTSA